MIHVALAESFAETRNHGNVNVRTLCKEEIVQGRKELYKFIYGEAFFPLRSWPKDMQLIFWKKPMGDEESFKLLLFFIGKGGGPTLISRWIMVAQFWAKSQQKAEKRARQVDFVLNNADEKRSMVSVSSSTTKGCFLSTDSRIRTQFHHVCPFKRLF